MMKKVFCTSLSLLLAVTMTGCSLFLPRKQTISVNGQPADAIVVVNGQRVTAPAKIAVPRNKPVSVMVTKDGYGTYMHTSSYSLNTWGLLDIIGGFLFLVPFVGLLAPGAFDLDQENYYFVLSPAKK